MSQASGETLGIATEGVRSVLDGGVRGRSARRPADLVRQDVNGMGDEIRQAVVLRSHFEDRAAAGIGLPPCLASLGGVSVVDAVCPFQFKQSEFRFCGQMVLGIVSEK